MFTWIEKLWKKEESKWILFLIWDQKEREMKIVQFGENAYKGTKKVIRFWPFDSRRSTFDSRRSTFDAVDVKSHQPNVIAHRTHAFRTCNMQLNANALDHYFFLKSAIHWATYVFSLFSLFQQNDFSSFFFFLDFLMFPFVSPHSFSWFSFTMWSQTPSSKWKTNHISCSIAISYVPPSIKINHKSRTKAQKVKRKMLCESLNSQPQGKQNQ